MNKLSLKKNIDKLVTRCSAAKDMLKFLLIRSIVHRKGCGMLDHLVYFNGPTSSNTNIFFFFFYMFCFSECILPIDSSIRDEVSFSSDVE